MRTTVILGDEVMQELLDVTSTGNMTQAVSTAVSEYLRWQRWKRLEKLRALGGKIDILSNGEVEAAELQELED